MGEAVGVASIIILVFLFLAMFSPEKGRRFGGLITGNTSEPPPKPKRHVQQKKENKMSHAKESKQQGFEETGRLNPWADMLKNPRNEREENAAHKIRTLRKDEAQCLSDYAELAKAHQALLSRCACANLPEPATNIRVLVEATNQLITETDVECDCVEASTSDVEPHTCAKHAAIEAIKPFRKEKKCPL